MARKRNTIAKKFIPSNGRSKKRISFHSSAPLLAPAAELLSSIFNLGWLSRDQIITAYGQLGHRLIVVMYSQLRVIRETIRKTDKGYEQCYSIADKRFSGRSPAELMSALEDAARKAGVKL